MATELHEVQPGGLIRAEFFNEMLRAVEDLRTRVAALEGEEPTTTPTEVVIESVTPRTVRMGEPLTITGRNFGWTTGATVVFLGERLITAFTSGSNTQLVFTVPDMPDFPASGLPLQLAVSNATDTDTDTVNVLPRAVAPSGDVAIAYVGTNPTTPTAGLFTIEYAVTSHVSMTVEVVLTPVVSTGWSPVRVLAGSPATPLPSNRLTLPRLETRTVFVEITIPGGATTGTPFEVELRGASAGVVVATASRDFQIGSGAPQEDETIDLSAPDGTELAVAPGGDHTFEVLCVFSETGDYHLTTSFEPSAGGWSIDTSDVQDPIPITDTSGTGGTVPVTLVVSAPTSPPATQPVTLVIEVQKEGRTTSRTLPVELTVST
jgi:hypothetical protein